MNTFLIYVIAFILFVYFLRWAHVIVQSYCIIFFQICWSYFQEWAMALHHEIQLFGWGLRFRLFEIEWLVDEMNRSGVLRVIAILAVTLCSPSFKWFVFWLLCSLWACSFFNPLLLASLWLVFIFDWSGGEIYKPFVFYDWFWNLFICSQRGDLDLCTEPAELSYVAKF